MTSTSVARKLVLMAGNPNSGKSTLFNLLTGLNQKVGNYPGVTVDKKTGVLELGAFKEIEILDLPGAYSMYPSSKDERIVVRQFLETKPKPDLILYVADLSQLEKQILLLTQIIDLGLPVILALNMADMTGITIQTHILEEHFKIPVVLISGKTSFGITALKMQMNFMLYEKFVAKEPYYKFTAQEKKLTDQFKNSVSSTTDYGRLLTLHHGAWIDNIPNEMRQEIKEKSEKEGFNPIQSQIHETMDRYDRFTPVIRKALHLVPGGAGAKITDRIDKWVMHPVLGSIIFFLIMLLIFQAIFAWAEWPMNFIEYSMGELNLGIRHLLPTGWISDLLCDGVLAGLTGILVFIPQIAILFLFIGILEEIGYMSRAVSMFDMMMRKFGLNGRSIVALVSGGACAIPAIMSTRSISNWKERLITIMVTPFISCSARIPVYAILIGFAVPKGRLFGFEQQGLALMGLYGIGIMAALTAAYILKKLLHSSDRSFLMMELPVYRPPVIKNLFYLVIEKTKSFVLGAGKIIIIISLVLWFLASFGPAMKSVAGESQPMDKSHIAKLAIQDSYAGILGKFIEPVIAPLGFDWKMGIALISSFAAREVFVGTMATIYRIEDDSDVASIRTRMAEDRHSDTGVLVYNPATTWSLLIFYAFAMQCMSTLAIVKRETRSWKWPIIQFVMMTGLAYLASWLVYHWLK
ncbi:MAG: ferrous iron transport protein B [Saprospiraceae bacterium]|uniref:Ferrous iron transport protein B n=1 Tax=Candidatus Opimibacter skivensis TaxID=2982028 RepID=A0A9D7XLM1_9BACT|nr:ferrous iron transport protein B [Candidatus Opimibacter skivensis]